MLYLSHAHTCKYTYYINVCEVYEPASKKRETNQQESVRRGSEMGRGGGETKKKRQENKKGENEKEKKKPFEEGRLQCCRCVGYQKCVFPPIQRQESWVRRSEGDARVQIGGWGGGAGR